MSRSYVVDLLSDSLTSSIINKVIVSQILLKYCLYNPYTTKVTWGYLYLLTVQGFSQHIKGWLMITIKLINNF